MDYAVLENSALFRNIPAKDIQADLDAISWHIRRFDRDETVFSLMEKAEQIGIVLEGRVQARKTFPNGSQVNVSVCGPSDLVGAAAAFSSGGTYPCDIVSLGPAALLMLRRTDVLALMQKDVRILENLMTEIASAACMLQQRLELFSYSGIAQKAAFWLLTQARQTGEHVIRIPGSVAGWAMMMNVSRPSLHRELKKLESAGILLYRPPLIEISDMEKLRQVLSR